MWDKDSHENIREVTINGSILPNCIFESKEACWAVKTPGVLHIDLGLRDSTINHELVVTLNN
jgi:hypothetical protein